jgi:hypothetical protein
MIFLLVELSSQDNTTILFHKLHNRPNSNNFIAIDQIPTIYFHSINVIGNGV